MDAATRYAREFLLSQPALVVLHAPTGYLKTSTARVAAQLAASAAIVDCRDLHAAADVAAALRTHLPAATETGPVDDFIAFENAETALNRPDVLAAIHAVLARRAARQTIAICTRRPFPLPADLLASAVYLTHEDLALDVAEELQARGLPPERIAEIGRLTLGWPMPTYRLAALAAGCPPGVPLAEAAGRGYERLLQDVRLDFVDRLPAQRRAHLVHGPRDLLASKRLHADGVLLRDGTRLRVPAILDAALGTATLPASGPVRQRAPGVVPAPPIVFDVLSGEITANGAPVRLPRRELEVFENLAIKGRPVSYDVLLEEVWGDADDDHAKLKVTVGRLRKRLGFATIRSVDAGYAAGPNVSCTLGELEELACAAEPFGPAMLARLEAIRARHRRGRTGIARNWPWYSAWSAKIDAFVGHVAVALGNHALAQRRYPAALECARDAIVLDPTGQDAHEIALRALVAQGNVVAARQMLAAYAATLRRTLGIDPPDALARVVRDLAS
jgi:DNA-binding SARP family transcriptional activator